MDIKYSKLNIDDLTVDLFDTFNRYQEVKQCWRKDNGEWVLKDIDFVDNWGDSEKKFLTECLINTINTKGIVLAAFSNNTLVGFASLESVFFGSSNQYLQLTSIHTSYEYRGKGIGKNLFHMICQEAKLIGAKKIYISSHSSKETQAFYKKIGCSEALEINKHIAQQEPCDCQLEYDLQNFK